MSVVPYNNPPPVRHKNNRVKILFYHAGNENVAWLYTTALQLKTYIDTLYTDLSPTIKWLVPIQQKISDTELIERVKTAEVDILCTGHYVWNHESLVEQLSTVKKFLPSSVKIIAGGPNINVKTRNDFFEQYPFIDYAVYGPGEQAFVDILNHLILNKPLMALTASNCAWRNQKTGETVVADYKFVKMIDTSPFTHCKRLFSKMINDLQQTNLPVWLPYTLTRGCPYACTFCDWNSGFDNKVSRRKHTYQQEIDLFYELGIKNILLADANFGQYNEDIDIIEYFGQKNTYHAAEFTVSGNFSKLKKDTNLKIYHIMASTKLARKSLVFSIQDTNVEVLKNINRPDVGWEVHAAMADELTQAYPHITIKAQLIYGLPGQTPASWRKTLQQVTEKNMLPVVFLNMPLPASPSMYDPDYQQQFQYEYIKSNIIGFNGKYLSLIPKQCISFDQKQLVEMTVLSGAYMACALVKSFCLTVLNQYIEIEPMVNSFIASKWYVLLSNALYCNWVRDNNFFFSVKDSYDRPAEPDALASLLLEQDYFFEIVFESLNNDLQNKFLLPETKIALTQHMWDSMAKELS